MFTRKQTQGFACQPKNGSSFYQTFQSSQGETQNWYQQKGSVVKRLHDHQDSNG